MAVLRGARGCPTSSVYHSPCISISDRIKLKRPRLVASNRISFITSFMKISQLVQKLLIHDDNHNNVCVYKARAARYI
jgi:hypothetical protein